MKNLFVKGLTAVVLACVVSFSANAGLSRSQHDTAVGAVLGGIAGAAVGNDVTSTVAGAALGGVIGSQWNAGKHNDDGRYDHSHRAKYKKHSRRDMKHEFRGRNRGYRGHHHH